ncbi:MAG: lysophospholipid acyltransferase family protein [Bacteroidetes bacterium]|jgi:KDO2-lipid IV(A) lauroyltransferase|nr:lysophospholipid acyltransferase family protein [Bacteroidota bacterium]
MKKIGFLFIRSVARLLGFLPMRLLYFLADIVYVIAYYILRYRLQVVRRNLSFSFPEKTRKEQYRIEKQFYHQLSDLLVEYIKMTQISEQELAKRITFENPELLNQLADDNKSVFLALGHCGNWEWFSRALHLSLKHRPVAMYKRLSNPYFDDFVKAIRAGKGALTLIESKTAYRSLKQLNDKLNAVVILGDQSPSGKDQDYWTDFLNQETPFFNGLEKMAKALDYAVVFLENRRVKRGYYKLVITPITTDPKMTSTNYITERYARLLEQTIVNNPANWLWSHRRWKHKRNNIQAYA